MNKIDSEESATKKIDDKTLRKTSMTKNILTTMLFIVGTLSLMYLGKDLIHSKPTADICVATSDRYSAKWITNILSETEEPRRDSNISYPNIHVLNTIYSEDTRFTYENKKQLLNGCTFVIIENIEEFGSRGRNPLTWYENAISAVIKPLTWYEEAISEVEQYFKVYNIKLKGPVIVLVNGKTDEKLKRFTGTYDKNTERKELFNKFIKKHASGYNYKSSGNVDVELDMQHEEARNKTTSLDYYNEILSKLAPYLKKP